MLPKARVPTPPGDILLEEFLNPLSLTQVEAARRMGIPLNRLNEVVRGKRGVTADTAIRLARLLDTSPEFWMNLQVAHDLARAARVAEDGAEYSSRSANPKADQHANSRRDPQ
jgi:addiction module HigA family antidote